MIAQREEADKDIANINTKVTPAAVKHGSALAMMADPSKPDWGGDEDMIEQMDEDAKLLLGCLDEKEMEEFARQFTNNMNNEVTAREIIPAMTTTTTTTKGCMNLALPEKVKNATMLGQTNAYSDGSAKNPRGCAGR